MSLVKAGDDLRGPAAQFRKQGWISLAIFADDGANPLSILFDVMVNHGWTSIEDGEFELELESVEWCGWNGATDSQGQILLNLEYQVALDWEGLTTWLVVTVPHGGQFNSMTRDP